MGKPPSHADLVNSTWRHGVRCGNRFETDSAAKADMISRTANRPKKCASMTVTAALVGIGILMTASCYSMEVVGYLYIVRAKHNRAEG